jgi:hypothetical protein
VSHGAASEVDAAVFFGTDAALALVTADPVAWSLAHPCDCEALCTCDDDDAALRRLEGCT